MKLLFITLYLCAALIGGCATSPPERAPYGGADNVDSIDSGSLTGTWSIRVLNPIEGEEGTQASITLNPDGSSSGTSQVNAAGQEMVINMAGTWSIDGGYLITTLESTEETSGNALAQLAQGLVSSMIKNRTSRGDVFELSASRVVIVDTETRQAQEWTR